MCEICRMTICPGTCPNAEPPRVAYKCAGCGGEIFVGDTVGVFGGRPYCEDCIEDAQRVATEEDADDGLV